MAITKMQGHREEKRPLKPPGKGWYWSKKIVVNPKAPEQYRVYRSAWVRKPTFIEKHLPNPVVSVLSTRLRRKGE